MEWSHKWSGDIRNGLYDSLLGKGFIKEKDFEPFLGPFSVYLEAFFDLSTCRNFGMGVGPIPFTAILEYSRIYDFGDFESFAEIIRKMDACYLTLEARKSAGKDNGSTNSSKKNSN